MPTIRTSDPDGAVALMPRHVGVVMDGNRRWARKARLASPSEGHRRGADHIEDLLGWCEARRIEHLTVYVLSADNIRKRSATEIGFLFGLVTDVLPPLVTRSRTWSLHVSGDTGLLPDRAAAALREAEEHTAGRPAHLTLAIGYDGREDIVGGIRRAIREGAVDQLEGIDADAITSRLGGGPVKEIDLVIRTSGEQRLSGFCPWQTAHAEVHVSPGCGPTSASRTSTSPSATSARRGLAPEETHAVLREVRDLRLPRPARDRGVLGRRSRLERR